MVGVKPEVVVKVTTDMNFINFWDPPKQWKIIKLNNGVGKYLFEQLELVRFFFGSV